MASIDDELLRDAEEDAREIAFIRNYLPQELKDKFSDDELYYFVDVMADYFVESGLFDDEADDQSDVDIDLDAVTAHLAKQAKKEKMGDFDPEDLLFVVQGELEYACSEGEEE